MDPVRGRWRKIEEERRGKDIFQNPNRGRDDRERGGKELIMNW